MKVIDLSSRNGTFVNGERIGEKSIVVNDIVKVGRHTTFCITHLGEQPAVDGSGICAECGIEISSQDIQEKRAVRHGAQVYCQRCIERGIEPRAQRKPPSPSINFRETAAEIRVPPVEPARGPVMTNVPVSIHNNPRPPGNLPPRTVSKIGPYQVLDILGEGGMGFVYKAKHTYLENIVAIKVIKEEFASEPKIVKRFLQEAKLGISLEHPNILRVYDAGESEGIFFIAMEYFEGHDLSNIIKKHGPITPPLLIKLGIQMADALEHAHTHNVIHRDVKPSNVLVDRKGMVKLADFGLAKAREKAGQLTASGQMLGTIQYISPEQLEDARSVSPQTDTFSLGGTLYFSLTGFPPFGEEPPGKVIENILHNDPPSLKGVVANMPAGLEDIIFRAMSKKNKDRFPTMEDMKKALANIKL